MLSLKAFLGLDTTGFEVGMKRAQSMTDKFAHSLEHGIGEKLREVFSAIAVEEAIRRTVEYGAHIKDVSEQLGVSTDAVQQWDYALKQSGASVDAAAKFFEHLATARDKALGGDQAALDAFKKLGVSPGDLQNKRLEDIGLQIGNSVKEGDAQKLMASLREVGGKGANELTAAFKTGLEDLFAKAPLITAENIIAMKEIEDRFNLIGKKLMAGLAPALAWIGKHFAETFEKIQTAIDVTAAYWYTRLTGGSEADAIEAGKQARDESVDDLMHGEKERQDAIDRAKNGGDGGGSEAKEKQRPLTKDYYADFFAKEHRPKLDVNSLQQVGAYIGGGDPLKNEMAKLTKEVAAVGLTLKEYQNYARQIGKPAPSFNGSSDGSIQGRGVEF